MRFIPAPAGNTHSESISKLMNIGSSPRLRGTQLRAAGQVREIRFIPAPAGNTPHIPRSNGSGSVHPRACGEHGLVPQILRRAGRFIPAPAGNTATGWGSPRGTSVHPRACGEHRRAVRRSGPVRRFIPAPAGNTPSPPPARAAIPVHPRACGEHANSTIGRVRCAGSSPRLRGTRPGADRFRRPERFIPAPAGNTAGGARGERDRAVNPRACGEHGGHHGKTNQSVRFIPAPAGNTSCTCQPLPPVAVHPRACGEHHHRADRSEGLVGSSPRLRGTPA